MHKLLLLLVVGLTKSQLIIDSPCRELKVKTSFDIPSYMGLWYEIEKYEQSFQLGGDCVTAEYTLNKTSSEVHVLNSLTYLEDNSTSNTIRAVEGKALLSFQEVTPIQGKFNVSFFDQPADRSNYWVLDTDYVNYSIVWSCEDFFNGTAQGKFIHYKKIFN